MRTTEADFTLFVSTNALSMHSQEATTTSAKTVVVCSHCKTRGHSRRTCPELQANADSNLLVQSVPSQQGNSNGVSSGSGPGKTVRLIKGSQTLPRAQHAQRDDGSTKELASVVSQQGGFESGGAGKAKSSNDEDEEGSKLRSRCSFCGGTGHNARTCPQLAAAKEKEEQARVKEVVLCSTAGSHAFELHPKLH